MKAVAAAVQKEKQLFCFGKSKNMSQIVNESDFECFAVVVFLSLFSNCSGGNSSSAFVLNVCKSLISSQGGKMFVQLSRTS